MKKIWINYFRSEGKQLATNLALISFNQLRNQGFDTCSLLKTDEIVTQDFLQQLNIPSAFVYIRKGDQIYYANLASSPKTLVEISANPPTLLEIDQLLKLNVLRNNGHRLLSFQELDDIAVHLKHFADVTSTPFLEKVITNFCNHFENSFANSLRPREEKVLQELRKKIHQLDYYPTRLLVSRHIIHKEVKYIREKHHSLITQSDGLVADTLQTIVNHPEFMAARTFAKYKFLDPVDIFIYKHLRNVINNATLIEAHTYVKNTALNHATLKKLDGPLDPSSFNDKGNDLLFFPLLKNSLNQPSSANNNHLSSDENHRRKVRHLYTQGMQFFNLSETSYEQLLSACYGDSFFSGNDIVALDRLLARPSRPSGLRISPVVNILQGMGNFIEIVNGFEKDLPHGLMPYAPLLAMQAFKQKKLNDHLDNNEILQKITDHLFYHWFLNLNTFQRFEFPHIAAELSLEKAFKALTEEECNLKKLQLGILSPDEKISLWNALEKNTSLMTLDLSENPLTNEDIKALANVLKINTTLRFLKLVNCKLTNESVLKNLFEMLKVNNTLWELDLGNNSALTWEIIKPLTIILKQKSAYQMPAIKLDGNIYINAHWRKKLTDLQENTDVDLHQQILLEGSIDRYLESGNEKITEPLTWIDQQIEPQCIQTKQILEEEKEKYQQQVNLLESSEPPSEETQQEIALLQRKIALIDTRLKVIEEELSLRIKKRQTLDRLVNNGSIPPLEFYCLITRQLENVFFGCKAIGSNLIDCTEPGALTYTNQGLELGLNITCGAVNSIPVIGSLISLIIRISGQTALETSKYVDQIRRNETIKQIANAISFEDLENVPHLVANQLTKNYHEQLMELRTREEELEARDLETNFKEKVKAKASTLGEKIQEVFFNKKGITDAEKLGLLIIVRILTSLQEGKFDKREPLHSQLMAEVTKPLHLKEKCFHFLFEALGSETITTKTGKKWLLKDILTKPGVKVRNADGTYAYFTGPNQDHVNYGFREDTIEEVQRLNLTRLNIGLDKEVRIVKHTQPAPAKEKGNEKIVDVNSSVNVRKLTTYQQTLKQNQEQCNKQAEEVKFRNHVSNEFKKFEKLVVNPIKDALNTSPHPDGASSSSAINFSRLNNIENDINILKQTVSTLAAKNSIDTQESKEGKEVVENDKNKNEFILKEANQLQSTESTSDNNNLTQLTTIVPKKSQLLNEIIKLKRENKELKEQLDNLKDDILKKEKIFDKKLEKILEVIEKGSDDQNNASVSVSLTHTSTNTTASVAVTPAVATATIATAPVLTPPAAVASSSTTPISGTITGNAATLFHHGTNSTHSSTNNHGMDNRNFRYT